MGAYQDRGSQASEAHRSLGAGDAYRSHPVSLPVVRILAHDHYGRGEEVNEWPRDENGYFEVMVVDGIEYDRYQGSVYARQIIQYIAERETWDYAKAFIYLADDEIDEKAWLEKGYLKRKNEIEYEEARESLRKENTESMNADLERANFK